MLLAGSTWFGSGTNEPESCHSADDGLRRLLSIQSLEDIRPWTKPLKSQHRTSLARRRRSLENDGDPGPFKGAGFNFELCFGVLGQGARDEGTKLAWLRPCFALRQTNAIIGDSDAASVAIDHAVKRYRATFSSLEAVFECIGKQVDSRPAQSASQR